MDLIVTHINADFDAFSSAVAALRLYPGAVLCLPGSQEKRVRDFMRQIYALPLSKPSEVDASSVTRVIVLDTKSAERLGDAAAFIAAGRAEVHVFDHHEHAKGDIHGQMEHIEPVGATATLMAELLKARSLPPSPMEATALMLGIYQETGSLLYPSTTERDMRAAAYLLKRGASLNIVSTYLREGLSVDEVDLLSDLIHAMRESVIGGLSVVTAFASSDKYVGDAAHLAHRVMDMSHADAAVLAMAMQGKVLLVGRSRAPELDLTCVMKKFGGGGHPTAASATLRDEPLEILEERVLAAVRECVHPLKTALDVMTSPVITIGYDKRVSDAEAMMTRYEVNVIPVTDDSGGYYGLISREIAEKAIFHGLAASTLRDLAGTDAYTAEPETPAKEVEASMVELNQRFTAVLRDGAAVGAITRTDLLRSMYVEGLRRTGMREHHIEGRTAVTRNMRRMISEHFPAEVRQALGEAGRTASGMGIAAYLVGGSVRDLIRAETNPDLDMEMDVDIVVEGDGIAFAEKLAGMLSGRSHPHERFKTAKVTAPALRIDVASARTEFYESPGALPQVEMSSIKKDLYRRDFTINTLAVRLNPEDFGTLVDFFGGRRDIKDRNIKVLHNLSFVEDPTRAFRALRFAERFDFRLSKHTERLIKTALKMDLFNKITGTRLYDELQLIFNEPHPAGVIRRFADFGLMGVVHPDLKYTRELAALLESVEATLIWYDLLYMEQQPDRTLIYLTALVSELGAAQKDEAIARLMAPPKVADAVKLSIEAARTTLRKLPLADPALIHDALSHMSLESLLLSMAITKKDERKKEVSRYLLELRPVRTEMDGNDLIGMGVTPGPVFSEVFHAVLAERLRGNIKSRDEELAFARRYIAGKS